MSHRPRSALRGLASRLTACSLLAAGLSLGACSPLDDDTGERPGWIAGAGLLRGGGAFTWELEAGGHLPADVLDPGSRETDAERATVGADGWLPQGPVAPELARAWGTPPGARVYEAAPVMRVTLGGARPRLRHRGRDLSRQRMPGIPNLWRDGESGHTFWWRRDGLLTAVGMGPPGAVELIGDGDSAAATPGDGARDAVAPSLATTGPRVASVTLGDTTRRAVSVPAPGTLLSLARPVSATTLHVAVGLLPRAFSTDADGRLLHRALGGEPVAVRIEARVDEQVVVLHEQVLTALEPTWVEARLDLAGLSGQVARFAFTARPLREGVAGVPLVAWADLAFGGGVASPARGRRPHVVIVSLDTLRPDRLGLYGHDRDTSPRLDAWAASHAQVFDDALADSNWTLPSTATMLTGLATRQHGLLAFPAALGSATPTLAERLAAEGYDTLAITDGGFVGPTFGFDRGFDRFVVDGDEVPDWRPALDHLARRGADRPVFLFLHTYLAHSPWPRDERFAEGPAYDGPLAGRDLTDDVIDAMERGDLPLDEADHEEVRRLYDAGVARTDALIGTFLERIEALVAPDDRLVIVTSDHGEHLFDHGHVAHGHTLYDAVLRVPLLVSWPGASPLGRSAAPAAGVDLVPTVLDVLGLPIPEALPGRSLVAVGDAPVLRVGQHAEAARAAVLDGWKLIAPVDGHGPAELYDLSRDPGETDDLAARESDRVRTMRGLLDDWTRRHVPLQGADDADGRLDPGLAADLRALGYLGDDG